MDFLLLRARIHVAQAMLQLVRFLLLDEIRLGKEDAVGEADLRSRFIVLVERLLAVLRIDHGYHCVEEELVVDLLVHEERLRHGPRICQSGGLDDHAIELELPLPALLAEVAEDAHEVAAHGAAQATVVHLDDLLLLVLHQDVVVDAGLAELVLDDGDLLAVLLGENPVQQRRLARTEEAGEDRDGNEVFLGGGGGSQGGGSAAGKDRMSGSGLHYQGFFDRRALGWAAS